MAFQWNWMCLSVLLLSLVAADIEENNAEVEYNEDAEESDASPFMQVAYNTPQPTGEVYFSETFDDGTMNGWVLSRTQKEDTDDDIAKYDGMWEVEELKLNKVPGDRGLVLKSAAKHHAIAAMLHKPFIFDDQPLIVQYEVNFQGGIDCGGAYIKLLSNTEDLDLEQFFDKTPYTIMFGPDKCGEDYKLHFIFRHKNPKTGDYEEKHAKRPEIDLKTYFTDMKTHLYTLVLQPDDTFEMLIDQTLVSKGSLLEDMIPPVNPPKEIDDPHDKKPEEWDEHLKIPDPSAVKPDDWDEEEPATIEDPNAVKPEGWLDDEPEYIPEPNVKKPVDWDEETSGEWEAAHIPNPKCEFAPGCGEWQHPTITNPSYKGKWTPPMIENPNYQGIWRPRKILNPYYFEELHPFKMTSFSAIGLELWSMNADIYFDNFIICSEKEVADRWASDSWGIKKLVASANEPGVFSQLLLAAEENPWLWVLYFLTAGVPAGLLAFFFWPRKKTDDVLCQTIDEPRPSTKGQLEGVEKEAMQEEEDDLQYKKENEVEGETSEKEFEDEQKSNEENEAEVDSQEGEGDGNRSNKSSSDEEIKQSDDNTGYGAESVNSMRKRRRRKD